MNKSGGALGVKKLNSATALIQKQPRRLPYGDYVLHRFGCSQENDQLLRERRRRPYPLRRYTSRHTIGSGRVDEDPSPAVDGGHGSDHLHGLDLRHLQPHAAAVKVAHPLMLRAIAVAKKKNDRIDAKKIADCLRCDFLPECYMASTEIRERRRTLRYRNVLVRQAVQMKNKIAILLMEAGVSYNKQKLHKVGYFRELLATNQDIDEGLKPLLRLCRETVVRLGKTESALVRSLERDSFLVEREERLMTS